MADRHSRENGNPEQQHREADNRRSRLRGSDEGS